MSKISSEFLKLDAVGGYDEITAIDFSYYANEKALNIIDAFISANSENAIVVDILYQLRDNVEDLI